MPHRLLAWIAVTATTWSTAVSYGAQMSAQDGWSAVGECAQRGDERSRHACLDDVLRQAGLLTRETEVRDRQQQFGLEGGAGRVASPVPPPVPAPATPAVPEPRPPDVDRLQVEVAAATKGPDGKVVLTTTDGAVWQQTDSDTIQRLPTAGSPVNIRKASLGSYVCSLASRVAFRCRRTR